MAAGAVPFRPRRLHQFIYRPAGDSQVVSVVALPGHCTVCRHQPAGCNSSRCQDHHDEACCPGGQPAVGGCYRCLDVEARIVDNHGGCNDRPLDRPDGRLRSDYRRLLGGNRRSLRFDRRFPDRGFLRNNRRFFRNNRRLLRLGLAAPPAPAPAPPPGGRARSRCSRLPVRPSPQFRPLPLMAPGDDVSPVFGVVGLQGVPVNRNLNIRV